MHSKLIQPPLFEPLSLIEVKRHLRITHDQDDEQLMTMIKASRAAVESFLQISLITQHHQIMQRVYTVDEIDLPMGPVQDLLWVRMNDKVLDKTKFPIERVGNVFRLTKLDYIYGDLYVGYKTGFGDHPDDVPYNIKFALLLMIAYFYENRGEANLEMPMQVKELLQPYKCFGL